jgi:NAD(P)-dependent dehydrogenase (short-subunit alcohol dehydrogenase family)
VEVEDDLSDRSFGKESTAEAVAEGIDLEGKRALVTGASGGLGAETARVLALRGAAVTLTAREIEKGEAVAAEIRSASGNDAIDVMSVELSDPASVRAFAADYLARHSALQLLVNNAGVMGCPLGRTAEGYELQLATNHLGHFLLTCLLVPALRAGAPARVVNVSSRGHRFSPVVFDDLHFERRDYDKWVSYGQSKTANVLFSVALDARLAGLGIRAFALHPGAIMTELGRHLSAEDIAELQARAPGGKGMEAKTVPCGAATTVWAATAPELEGRGGLYLEDCGVAGPRISEEAETGYEAYALDAEAAERLWRVSEDLVHERFDWSHS